MQVREFLKEYADVDVKALALKQDKFKDIPFKWALSQVEGRQIAKYKLPTWAENWDVEFPIKLSMEQCSSEVTAKYKADVIKAFGFKGSFADLTGGFGVDCWAIGLNFDKVTYFEQNSELCRIAKNNYKALGFNNAIVVEGESTSLLSELDESDVIFIDPARRDGTGKKVFRLEDCTPNLVEIEENLINKSKVVVAKLSPMLDINQAVKSLGYCKEVHIVSVNGECKELLLILTKEELGVDVGRIKIVDLGNRGYASLNLDINDGVAYPIFASSLKRFLYEPHAGVMKAGGFRQVSEIYQIEKLSINSHLYTSDVLVDNFAGRIFEVIDVLAPSKESIKTIKKEYSHLNIATRNFPQKPEEIRKRIGGKDGGQITLFATILWDNKPTFILCKQILNVDKYKLIAD